MPQQMQPKITINSIAKMAQVSKGTVSRVLNNEPGVGPKTRERILKLIKDLDYKPSAIARSLVSLKANNLGIVLPSDFGAGLGTAFWPKILSSITQAAAESDMCILVTTFDVRQADVEASYQRILYERRVDGLITFADQLGKKRTADLVAGRYPFVSIGRDESMKENFVDVDNGGGARDMTEHIIRQGRRHIAFIHGPHAMPSVRARMAGFREAVGKHRAVRGKFLEVPYFSHETQKAIVAFLGQNPSVDALFIGAGDFALDGLIACKHLDLSVPDAIAFACFDDLEFYQYENLLTAPITSISQPIEELGREAVVMLKALITGETEHVRQKVLPVTLNIRQSCGEKSPAGA